MCLDTNFFQLALHKDLTCPICLGALCINSVVVSLLFNSCLYIIIRDFIRMRMIIVTVVRVYFDGLNMETSSVQSGMKILILKI